MAVIDGMYCLQKRTPRVIYKRETLSVVALEWSEIMDNYRPNTPETSER